MVPSKETGRPVCPTGEGCNCCVLATMTHCLAKVYKQHIKGLATDKTGFLLYDRGGERAGEIEWGVRERKRETGRRKKERIGFLLKRKQIINCDKSR